MGERDGGPDPLLERLDVGDDPVDNPPETERERHGALEAEDSDDSEKDAI
jgi:hypothetical protein